MSALYVQLVPLDRYNWESCLNIKLKPEQESFVPSVLYSLAQASFEKLFPFGISVEEEIVGFAMYGEFGGICWINRIMVDESYQNLGIGRKAIELLVEQLRRKMSCQEIRTSVTIYNQPALELFTSLGFVSLEGGDGNKEIVLRYERKKPSSGLSQL